MKCHCNTPCFPASRSQREHVKPGSAYRRVKKKPVWSERFTSPIFVTIRHAKACRGPRKAAQEIRQRSEENTSELQSLMRISYAVFCLKKKQNTQEKEKSNINKKQ